MSRVRHYDICSSLATRFPYVIAGKSFKSLNAMQDGELESFLSYLVRFEASEFGTDPKKPPKWWVGDLAFSKRFHFGSDPLPFTRDKLKNMKIAVQNFFSHYRATEMIRISAKLATISANLIWRRNGSKFVVIRKDTNKPLVVVSASNIDYDLYTNRVTGILMNTGIDLRFANGPKKRLRLYQGTKEEDSDDEYVDFLSEACQSPLSLGDFSPPDSAMENSNFELEEDFEFQLPTPPALSRLGLIRNGSTPSYPPYQPVWVKNKRIPCKSFNAVDVPHLVRMGVMPKWCLATDHAIAKRLREMAPFMDGRLEQIDDSE
ncbi:Hypothetical protein NTJ_06195 [Nesidiocoris tenuis]|uniref:PiggyBac transposable element-derived protein domain-containing protein n=1 Tax=Nesidiocoris tenuis TaxID=355587 RepID=A0ABN7AMA9_9HEMI|nr:Hypothetical protein NTJ_06195 [Nesidiocoris tenuis]